MVPHLAEEPQRTIVSDSHPKVGKSVLGGEGTLVGCGGRAGGFNCHILDSHPERKQDEGAG